jgi:tripartite-type tricarboxylate transporter receptor subunit TctC
MPSPRFLAFVPTSLSAVLTTLLLTGAPAAWGQAQDYPNKPIRMIQGVSSSSSSGLLGRMVSDWLAKDLKQTIVVENMSGAGGTLGMQTAAKARPDGYTLVMLTQAQAISESLFSKLGYRLIDDFQPISQIATGYYLLTVHQNLPVQSVKELIALAKSKPGALNYASSGNGTGTHLAAALFNANAGVDIVHVPFKGTAEGLAPFMNGSVQIYFLGLPSVQPLLKAGKARALAITASKRSPDLPNLPTVAESLPGYEMTLWQGIASVAGTPAPVINKLHASILRVLNTPEAKSQFDQQGTEVETNTPEVFKAYIKSQVAIFAEAIKASGAKVE